MPSIANFILNGNKNYRLPRYRNARFIPSYIIFQAEYDVCAQIIPDSTSLCRVDFECSLLVSLRRMSNQVDSRVAIIIDAESEYWTVVDKVAGK